MSRLATINTEYTHEFLNSCAIFSYWRTNFYLIRVTVYLLRWFLHLNSINIHKINNSKNAFACACIDHYNNSNYNYDDHDMDRWKELNGRMTQKKIFKRIFINTVCPHIVMFVRQYSMYWNAVMTRSGSKAHATFQSNEEQTLQMNI